MATGTTEQTESPTPKPWQAATVYAVLTVVMTSRVWRASEWTAIGGANSPDGAGTGWTYWSVAHALAQGQMPTEAPWVFFPVGLDPLAQYNIMDALLAVPLFWLFSSTVAYNLFACFVIWSTAASTDLLMRTIGVSPKGALFAGLALTTSASVRNELAAGRFSQAMLVFWLLGLAGLYRLSRGNGRWPLAVGTGLAIAAASLTYWYSGAFLILAGSVLWIFAFPTLRGNRSAWRNLGITAAVTGGCLLAPFLMLAKRYAMLPGVARQAEPWMEPLRHLTHGDVHLAMALSHSHWPWWPILPSPWAYDNRQLSLVLLTLALTALVAGPRPWRWITVGGCGYVLGLGPFLSLTQAGPTSIRLPFYYLHQYVPFFERFWWPERTDIMVVCATVILAALAVDRWARDTRSWLLILAALTFEAFIRPPVLLLPSEPFLPGVFESYATLNGKAEGALLTTPVLPSHATSHSSLWYQTIHERPILSGLGDHISSHRPAGYDAFVTSNGFLRSLTQLEDNPTPEVVPADVQELLELGFAWAVVDYGTFPAQASDGQKAVPHLARLHKDLFTSLWGTPATHLDSVHFWRIRPLQSGAR